MKPFTMKLRNPPKAKSSRKKANASPSTPPGATTPVTLPITTSPLAARQATSPAGSAAAADCDSKESSERDDEEEWEDEGPVVQTAQPSSRISNSAASAPAPTLSDLTIEQLAEHIGEEHVEQFSMLFITCPQTSCPSNLW
jgi:hypothetical protein